MQRSSHSRLLDKLNEQNGAAKIKFCVENGDHFILFAHKIEENMGCLFLENNLAPSQIKSFILNLKRKLEECSIDAQVSQPTKTFSIVIDFLGQKPADDHWNYITKTLLRLPDSKIRDVSALAFDPIILDGPENTKTEEHTPTNWEEENLDLSSSAEEDFIARILGP